MKMKLLQSKICYLLKKTTSGICKTHFYCHIYDFLFVIASPVIFGHIIRISHNLHVKRQNLSNSRLQFLVLLHGRCTCCLEYVIKIKENNNNFPKPLSYYKYAHLQPSSQQELSLFSSISLAAFIAMALSGFPIATKHSLSPFFKPSTPNFCCKQQVSNYIYYVLLCVLLS